MFQVLPHFVTVCHTLFLPCNKFMMPSSYSFRLFFFSLFFFFFFSASLSLAGSLGHLTWVRHHSCKSSATHSCQCAVFLCAQTIMVWLPVFGIFLVHTDVDACICTLGLHGHRKTVCNGSWLWEKNPLPHWGLEPASVLHLAFQSDALTNWAIPAPKHLSTSPLTGLVTGVPWQTSQWFWDWSGHQGAMTNILTVSSGTCLVTRVPWQTSQRSVLGLV